MNILSTKATIDMRSPLSFKVWHAWLELDVSGDKVLEQVGGLVTVVESIHTQEARFFSEVHHVQIRVDSFARLDKFGMAGFCDLVVLLLVFPELRFPT